MFHLKELVGGEKSMGKGREMLSVKLGCTGVRALN